MSLVQIRFEGEHSVILASMRSWRQHGIPFFALDDRFLGWSALADTYDGPLFEKIWLSSKKLLRWWEECRPDRASFYGWFRERDVELALMCAGVRGTVVK